MEIIYDEQGNIVEGVVVKYYSEDKKMLELLVRERRKVVGYHLVHQFFQPPVGPAFYLQQQTLLQRPGTDACRVEVLNDGQDSFHFFLIGIDTSVEHQLVNQRADTFP